MRYITLAVSHDRVTKIIFKPNGGQFDVEIRFHNTSRTETIKGVLHRQMMTAILDISEGIDVNRVVVALRKAETKVVFWTKNITDDEVVLLRMTSDQIHEAERLYKAESLDKLHVYLVGMERATPALYVCTDDFDNSKCFNITK